MIIVELKAKGGRNIIVANEVLITEKDISITTPTGVEHHLITQHSRQARDGCYLIKATINEKVS